MSGRLLSISVTTEGPRSKCEYAGISGKAMNMRTMLIAALLVLATSAHAQQTRFYDSRGNSLGTATTSPSGQTTFRDSRGNTTGTATTNSSGTTTFYDRRGNAVGRSSR
jgi:hypothetical protein